MNGWKFRISTIFLLGTAMVAPPAAADPPAPSTIGTPAAQHSAEDFAQLPFIEQPALSPDGTKVAARVAVNGEQLLAIMTLGQPGTPVLLRLGETDLNDWFWVNNDWLVARVGNSVPFQGEDIYVSRALGISADGKTINRLAFDKAAQGGDRVIWTASDGRPEILLALQQSIYIDRPGFWPDVELVDVSTGKTRNVQRPIDYVMSWYADAQGSVRMGVGYVDAKRQSRLYYRAPGNGTLKVVDRADRRQHEQLTVPALFLADPGKAIAYDDGDGFDALYQLNLDTLELGERIFAVPGFDLGDIIEDAAGTGIAGVRYTDDAPRTHWFDARMAQIQAEIDKAVGDRRAQIVSWNRDWSKLLVSVGGADRVSAYYFFQPDTGVMQLFAKQYDRLGSKPLSPVRTIRYKARDGLEIAAVLTLPHDRDPHGLPLIVLPHGGPFARDSETFDWWVQFLADRGYAVIQPNYRGSSGYGNEFARKGEGQWGLAMQDDLNDAVDWAVKQGIADAGRVCIAGASYGGYAALRGAQRDGTRYRCAISYAGVSDLSAIMRYDRRFLNHSGRNDWLKEQAPDFAAVSPINYASQFSTPVLILHGKKDMRVPYKQSRDMAEKLKAAGKNVTYIEQPEADHYFTRAQDRLQFLKEMEAFLARYNPA